MLSLTPRWIPLQVNDVVLEESRPVVLLHGVVEVSQLVRCPRTYMESHARNDDNERFLIDHFKLSPQLSK